VPSIRLRVVTGILLLIAGTAAAAAVPDDGTPVLLPGAARVYVTLVPQGIDPRGGQHGVDLSLAARPALNLSLRTSRRNRLEFSLGRHDVLDAGDHLQIRLASDAHVIAQLLSGGRFSQEDDSWIAILGLSSRLKLSYDNGPWQFSLTACRQFGGAKVRARLTYAVRF
jgi:hypothetical protein